MKIPILLSLVMTGSLFAAPPNAELSPAEKSQLTAMVKKPVELRRILGKALQEFDKGRIPQAKFLLEQILREIEQTISSKDQPTIGAHASPYSAATMKNCFFSQCFYFRLLHQLAGVGAVDHDVLARSQKIAEIFLAPMERGPNNRPFHYALAHIYAAKLFPNSPKAPEWNAYANAVWNDWWLLGDSYEPGYISHNIKQAIELGTLLGKTPELKSADAAKIFARYRDQISQTGLSQIPGDGGRQSDYIEALIAMAKVTGDPSFRDTALAAFRAGDYGPGGKRRENTPENQEACRQLLAGLPDSTTAPAALKRSSMIQSLYATTSHALPERMILANDKRYAAIYLNDSTNTTFHGHEDNRGDIFHYEVDGVLYLSRSGGWSKWIGHANSFVVGDEQDEFPFYQTLGIRGNHWYRASSNMRLLRDYLSDGTWTRTPDKPHGTGQFAFHEVKNPNLGYSWVNPSGQRNLCDRMELNSISLNLQNMVKGAPNRFPQKVMWYREYRDVASTSGTYEILLDNLAISGPAGKKVLETFDRVPDGLSVEYYPEGSLDNPALKQTIQGKALAELVSVTPEKQLRVVCRPGLTVLNFTGYREPVDFNRSYNRIDFDYNYPRAAPGFLRPPVKVAVNAEMPRSIYVDHQQGGLLKKADFTERNGDLYGEIAYDGVFSHDSKWSRKTLFLKEGYLIVMDIYDTGKTMTGAVAGPVWHVPAVAQSGINWFDAAIDPEKGKNMVVYFHPERGARYGTQYQPKLWNNKDTAVYAQKRLTPGARNVFLTVMIPHDSRTSGEKVTGQRHQMNHLEDPRDKRGVRSTLQDDGRATVEISAQLNRLSGANVPVTVEIGNDGWQVKRGEK